jgi:hypothetical protein
MTRPTKAIGAEEREVQGVTPGEQEQPKPNVGNELATMIMVDSRICAPEMI